MKENSNIEKIRSHVTENDKFEKLKKSSEKVYYIKV